MGSGSGSSLGPPGRRRTRNTKQAGLDAAAVERGPSDVIRRTDAIEPSWSNGLSGLSRGHRRCGWRNVLMDTDNESNQADRTISTGKLHALLHFHTRPINVVVFHGSQGNARFEVGFPLRCLQRLSRPYIAMLHCRWRDNSSTRGTFTPVLSY